MGYVPNRWVENFAFTFGKLWQIKLRAQCKTSRWLITSTTFWSCLLVFKWGSGLSCQTLSYFYLEFAYWHLKWWTMELILRRQNTTWWRNYFLCWTDLSVLRALRFIFIGLDGLTQVCYNLCHRKKSWCRSFKLKDFRNTFRKDN